jgi:hypothetical protein
VPVGNFRWIDFDRFAAGKKCDFVFLRGGRVFDFFDVRIAAAHILFSLNRFVVTAESKRDFSLRSK